MPELVRSRARGSTLQRARDARSRARTCAGRSGGRVWRSWPATGAVAGAAARATAPGGQLVYSVCTISRAESEGVVQSFLASHPEFTLALERQLLPPPRRHRRVLHRAPRASLTCGRQRPAARYARPARPTPRSSSARSVPPAAEPWLRPTAVPGQLPVSSDCLSGSSSCRSARTAVSIRRSCGCRAPRSRCAITARARC